MAPTSDLLNNPQTDQQQQDEYWMRRALQLAQRAAELNEVPVGAIVVCNGEVIGEGWNQPISGCDPTAHAEVMALRQAAQYCHNYRLPHTTLYVTIEPCTMCAGALVHARVSEVVFAALEPKAGAVISQSAVFDQANLNHQVMYRSGVLAQEAMDLMQSFFKRRRQEAKRKKVEEKKSATGN